MVSLPVLTLKNVPLENITFVEYILEIISCFN